MLIDANRVELDDFEQHENDQRSSALRLRLKNRARVAGRLQAGRERGSHNLTLETLEKSLPACSNATKRLIKLACGYNIFRTSKSPTGDGSRLSHQQSNSQGHKLLLLMRSLSLPLNSGLSS